MTHHATKFEAALKALEGLEAIVEAIRLLGYEALEDNGSYYLTDADPEESK